MKQILSIVGARPNFMKVAPILRALEDLQADIGSVLIHTGQHFDERMCDSVFRDLGLRQPDVNLEVSGGGHAAQTANVMLKLEPILTKTPPALVLVVGDVNSTLAASLAAAKLNIPIAHVEAGLRSFDRTMPEEINRLCTDAISTLLFTTSRDANENLRREGIPDEKIHFVGNVMIDTLYRLRDAAGASPIVEQLRLSPRQFGLLTLHRPGNVDDPHTLARFVGVVNEICERIPLVFPTHPRTLKQLDLSGHLERLRAVPNLRLLPPLGYLDFVALEMNAAVVLTDSGGVQEETTVLRVPCLTLRENTERPVTVTHGTNRVVGRSPQAILMALEEVLAGPSSRNELPERWDGAASTRIATILRDYLCGGGSTVPHGRYDKCG